MLRDAYSTAESDGNKYFLAFPRFGITKDEQTLLAKIVQYDASGWPQDWAFIAKYGADLSSSYSTDMCMYSNGAKLCYSCVPYDPLCIWGWIDHFRSMVSGSQFQTDEGTIVSFDQSALSAISQYQSQTNKSYSQMNNSSDISGILQIIHPQPVQPIPTATPTGTGATGSSPAQPTTTLPVVGAVPTSYLYYGAALLAAYFIFTRKRPA